MIPDPRRLCALLVAAIAAAAAAEPPGGAAAGTAVALAGADHLAAARPPPDARGAHLALALNGAWGEVVEVRLDAGDAWVRAGDLERAGLHRFEGIRRGEWVSLRSLAPAVSYALDDDALALRLDAAAERLGTSEIRFSRDRGPAGLQIEGRPTAFLDYAVQATTERHLTAFLEAGASAGGRLLQSSASRLQDGSFVRNLTSLQVDERDALRRWVAGDAVATSGPLGGTLALAGLGVAREFALDPYFVRAPLPGGAGFAPTPSVLEVYVNGVLVREQPIPAGSFTLEDLPVTGGASTVRAVVRDPFGRTQSLDSAYYIAPSLLAPGLSEYAYHAGFRREDYGLASFEYGPPLLVARHRVGLTDALTLGARLDAARGLASGGPAATLGTPIGAFELAGAASVDGGRAGGAGHLAWSWASPRFAAGASGRLQSDRYAHAALAASEDRASADGRVYAAAPVGRRLHLHAEWSATKRRDDGVVQSVSGRALVRLARRVALGLTATGAHASTDGASFAAFATLSWSVDGRTLADASASWSEEHGGGGGLGASRALSAGPSYGYRLRASDDGQQSWATGILQAQGDHGRLEASWSRVRGADTGAVAASGSLVLVEGKPFATRPLHGAYALVQVPGVAGVRAYLDRQPVGRTDADGDLLVPGLSPYHGHRLAIADEDVPLDVDLPAEERLVGATSRGSTRARFEVRPIRSVQGRFLLVDGGDEIVPAFGALSLSAGGERLDFPLGAAGGFYLEGVPQGTHRAEVLHGDRACSVGVSLPVSETARVDLGIVRCTLTTASPARIATPTPTPTPTSTSTPTPIPSSLSSQREQSARGREQSNGSVASALPPPPPPGGYGPRTRRCPSCAVCLSAALNRLATPTTQSRCVDGLSVMRPIDGRAAAAKACLVEANLDELCTECVRKRWVRRCPTWPKRSPR